MQPARKLVRYTSEHPIEYRGYILPHRPQSELTKQSAELRMNTA